jgi:hypothetical protein
MATDNPADLKQSIRVMHESYINNNGRLEGGHYQGQPVNLSDRHAIALIVGELTLLDYRVSHRGDASFPLRFRTQVMHKSLPFPIS